jgi:hypothetical protein
MGVAGFDMVKRDSEVLAGDGVVGDRQLAS